MASTTRSRFAPAPLLPAAVSLVLLPLLLGCDSSPTGDDPGGLAAAGTFNANVTGHVTTSFSGEANSAPGAPRGWGIALGTGAPPSIVITTLESERPAAGTYSIIESALAPGASETVFFASFVAELGAGSYTSTSGTLTIQSSSPSSVVGSFSFQAQRGTVGNPLVVNVQGTFNATNRGG